ncbi:MAG: hypothetical protein WCE38_07615 [Burkholderiales bacterium]
MAGSWTTSPAFAELSRSSDKEKQSQLKRLRDYQKRRAKESPAMP